MGVRGDDRLANVLVTAAGRRTALVRAFVDVAHTRGGHVIATDVDPLAPALLVGDVGVRTPRTDDPDYIPELLRIVDEHAIGVVIPTIDPDLSVLASCQPAFQDLGCRVVISSPSFVATVLDKLQTARVFGAAGIAVPRTWQPPLDGTEALPEQVFVKPRHGSASMDTYQVPVELLGNVLALVDDPVIQNVLTGPEITIDALMDLRGSIVHYVPRQRIRTVGGESTQGVTLPHEPALAAWIERVLGICGQLGAIGPLTVQAFLTEVGPVLTEINARFGGGFPLGLEAGGAYPEWILDMVGGMAVQPRIGRYEPGLYMTRHHTERFLRHPAW